MSEIDRAEAGLLRGMAVALVPACLFWAGVGALVWRLWR